MKSLLKILAFIPLCIDLLLLLVVSLDRIGKVGWVIHIPITMLLAFIGISIISKRKIIQRIGIAALAALTIIFCIMGYYDYIQWFSSIVGVILFIYFIFLKIVMKKLEDK